MATIFDPTKVKKEVDETRGESHQFIPPIEPLPEAIEVFEYEHLLMLEHMNEDSLFVVASGLGVERMFLNYLMLYSSRKLLAFVINTTQQDETFFLSKLHSLPANEFAPPKVINSEVLGSDREALYLQGGVQFITSRILMVDFLTNRVPAKMVAAILVYRSHQLLNSFQETFILRLYREKNPEGRVKAFTDMPMAFSGIGQLQRLVDRLFVRKVHLLPRHDASVMATFARDPPSSIELSVDLSGSARRCISLITDLLKVCLRELKQSSVRNKTQEEEESDSFNAGLYFTTDLEKRLKLKRSYLPDRQQRLLSDLELLRSLLRIAETLDPCTVLSKLNWISQNKEAMENSSGWLLTPTGTRLMALAQELASSSSNRPEFVEPPKWIALQSVLDEIKELYVPKEQIPDSGPRVLIFVADEQTQLQVIELIKKGIKRTKCDLKRRLRQIHAEPPLSPMWDPDQVSAFVENETNDGITTRKEVVGNIQKKQKEAARVAKKRKKVAESLIAIKQKNLEHFGVVVYKKLTETREKVDQPSSSNTLAEKESDVKQEDLSATDDTPLKLGEYEKFPLYVVTSTSYGSDRYNTIRALQNVKPTIIIMYNTDLAALRQVEVFHASHSDFRLYFYSLQYAESTEEERYLSKLSRENEAFSNLKNEAENLLVGREYDTVREEAPRLSVSTLNAGGFEEGTLPPPKIIVDMREFNSELPTILYKKGYEVVAATLEVGDYVLSPGMTVERKALDDLTQSLQSGRVFKQTEQMHRNYGSVFLLIESNTRFELKIVNGGPFQGELSRHCREIRLQLCSLIRSFPKLHLLWSLSPTNSAEYFADLKINASDPDVDKAVAIRGDDVNEEDVDPKRSNNRLNSVILRHMSENLPNLNKGLTQKLMISDAGKNLSELLKCDVDKLKAVLPDQGDTLHLLFNFDFRNK